MTYAQRGDRVTLEMTQGEFGRLLFLVGSAAGAAVGRGNRHDFWQFIRLANDLNTGNPSFRAYEIPEDGHA